MRSKNNSGFTLLEVIIALTLLAVALIAVMRLFPASLRQTQIAAERKTVASLANTELGAIKARGVGEPLSHWAVRNALRTMGEMERAQAMYEGWQATVQRVGSDVDLYRVTFSVEMFDGRHERFVTYVTRY